ncbi:MAG: hypothetical protein ACM358_17540 [Gemmatimonadota bacterium]
MNARALALALLLAVPTPSPAQNESAHEIVSRAIRAYGDLDFDLAATLLRRALSKELSDSDRVQALTYLGAAEHYRARPDSARAVFRRLRLLAPGFQLDTLVFPPEVTHAFEEVQLAVSDTLSQPPAVAVRPAPPPPPPPARSSPPAAPPDSSGQLPVRWYHGIMAAGGGIVASVRAHSEGGLPSASGTVFGLAASARLGRFALGFKYLEGSLGSRDLVEGAAALRFVPRPWLTLHAGPHVRRYETSLGGGAERWAWWQVGARAEAPIVGRVRGHAMLWQGLGLSVNVQPGSGTARGGEIGATIVTPGGPFRFGIAYSFDHASVQGASRSETVGALILTAGVLTP